MADVFDPGEVIVRRGHTRIQYTFLRPVIPGTFHAQPVSYSTNGGRSWSAWQALSSFTDTLTGESYVGGNVVFDTLEHGRSYDLRHRLRNTNGDIYVSYGTNSSLYDNPGELSGGVIDVADPTGQNSIQVRASGVSSAVDIDVFGSRWFVDGVDQGLNFRYGHWRALTGLDPDTLYMVSGQVHDVDGNTLNLPAIPVRTRPVPVPGPPAPEHWTPGSDRIDGFRVHIGDDYYEVESYDVEEAGTPTAAGDSTGHVGTITLSVPYPDPYVEPGHRVFTYGVHDYIGQNVVVEDARKGFTLGMVRAASLDEDTGLINLDCDSYLGKLAIYDVSAGPYKGSLEGAFNYYCTLAGVEAPVWVDPTVRSIPVRVPGWYGELWDNLKKLAAANDCDIALVSGVIVLRPIRVRVADTGNEITLSQATGGGSLARAVEVIQYNNRSIENQLVYPPVGWTEDTQIISIAAGELVVQELPLEASVTSILPPKMVDYVPKYGSTDSEFCVIDDQGKIVKPDTWRRFGGYLNVRILPDTKTLELRVRAPVGVWSGVREEMKPVRTFSIAYQEGETDGYYERYASLRIIGSGVAFSQDVVTVPTGVDHRLTDNPVGVTIDNPFISTRDQAFRMGVRAAKMYNGMFKTIRADVTAVNKRGDTGMANLPTWNHFIDKFPNGISWATAETNELVDGKTWQQITDDMYLDVRDVYENQVFGNVNGARIWHEKTRRWYRIREASVTPEMISVQQADDDLTFGDVEDKYMDFDWGTTWDEYRIAMSGVQTWKELDLVGLR